MPQLFSSLRRKSRPAVHSGLLGENRGSSAPTEVAPPPAPLIRSVSPEPEINVSTSGGGPAVQSEDAYLQLGNHVRHLVREATKKKLKDVDHEANTRVLNFVKHNQCPIVLDELAKVLCEKLSSNWVTKQWLAVKLIDRLYSANVCDFEETKEMVESEIMKVYQKHIQLAHPTSYKCRIEASRLLQKMTGVTPQANDMAAGCAMIGPNGSLVLTLPQQCPDGTPQYINGGNVVSPGLQQFGVAAMGHNQMVQGGTNQYVVAPGPHARSAGAHVDTNLLKREVSDKAGMAVQHADILQELLCNFSTGDSVENEEDTVEMLSELSQQSKDLLASINSLVLRCQEHIDAPGIAEAVGEATLAMDKLRDALDLNEDVLHTRKMQRQPSEAQRAREPVTMGTPVEGVPVSSLAPGGVVRAGQGAGRSHGGSFGPSPSAGITPSPPPAAPLSARIDTNPFRRLTHTEEDMASGSSRQPLGQNRARRPRVGSSEAVPSVMAATSQPPRPHAQTAPVPHPPPLIDLQQPTTATTAGAGPSSSSTGPPPSPEPQLPKTKDMEQLETLFDTSMDLLTGSQQGEEPAGGEASAARATTTRSNPFDSPS